MSLALKLILSFAVVFAVAIGALGYGAVRVAGDTVERGIEARIGATLAAVRANPSFFLYEASIRKEQLRQLADISGFEIVVPGLEVGTVASSLPRETALDFLDRVPGKERFEIQAGGIAYRVSRARRTGRSFYLLCPVESIEDAKREAERPILWLAGIGLVTSVVLGGVLARTFTRPVGLLAERAAQVGGENMEVEIPRGGGREVERLSDAFREMLGRVARYREKLVRQEKMATLGEFSAAVAHELRNPLSSMRMSLEMLKPKTTPEVAAELDRLLSEMGRLDHSVEELLFHAGTPHYRRESFDARDAVDEAVRTLRPLSDHLGVALSHARCDSAVALTGDPGKIRQAVMNLLLNGIHAAGADGAVEVRSAVAGDRAVISVGDTGDGPPERIEESLFEPFVTGRDGGTGLGLAVTRAIAEAHGGAVEWERVEAGTVFQLVLPRGGE